MKEERRTVLPLSSSGHATDAGGAAFVSGNNREEEMLDATQRALDRLETACHELLTGRTQDREPLLQALASTELPLGVGDPADTRGLGGIALARARQLQKALKSARHDSAKVHGSVRRLCVALAELRVNVERELLEREQTARSQG